MDLLSLSRESYVEVMTFCRTEGSRWARLVANPVREIVGIDLEAPNAAWSATRFFVFVLALTLAIDITCDVAFTNVKVQKPSVLLALILSDAIEICQIGPLLYFPAKLLAGKGSFWQCMLTGTYLSAFLPIGLLVDYIFWADPWMRNIRLKGWDHLIDAPLPNTFDMSALVLLLVVGLAFNVWLLVRTIPVVRHLHTMGNFRAFLTLAIGCLLYNVLLVIVFDPLFVGLNHAK